MCVIFKHAYEHSNFNSGNKSNVVYNYNTAGEQSQVARPHPTWERVWSTSTGRLGQALPVSGDKYMRTLQVFKRNDDQTDTDGITSPPTQQQVLLCRCPAHLTLDT